MMTCAASVTIARYIPLMRSDGSPTTSPTRAVSRPAGRHAQPHRNTELANQQRGGEGPHADKAAMADRDQASEARQQIEAKRSDAGDQQCVDDVHLVRRGDQRQRDEQDEQQHKAGVTRVPHHYTRSMPTRPNRPYGFTIRMAIRTKNGNTCLRPPPSARIQIA